MTLHVTSDTHDSHKNILGFPSCNKFRYDLYGPKEDPESVVRMNEGIVKIWNSTVKQGDTVYHLGDVSLAYGKKAEEALRRFLDKVNGHIILLRGNHDNRMTTKVFLEYGHEVCDYKRLDLSDGRTIIMSHYPMYVWDKHHHGSVMLHGHCHGSLTGQKGKILDVGWDCHGHVLTLDEAYKMANEADKHRADHHQ